MRSLSFRRAQYQRCKQKARKLMKQYWGYKEEWLTPAILGARADTFSVCSCWMCRNERHSGILTRQEIKANVSFNQQLKEVI